MTVLKLQKLLPWTKAPVIINGPMIGAACPLLASEVSKAGGLGEYRSEMRCWHGLIETARVH